MSRSTDPGVGQNEPSDRRGGTGGSDPHPRKGPNENGVIERSESRGPRLPTLADRGRALLATRRRQHDPDGIAIDAALGAAENHAALRDDVLHEAAALVNRLAAMPEPDPPVYVIGRFVALVDGWRFETCDELTWVWLEARERLEKARNTDPTWGLWELRQATPTAQELP